jgi:hypothetical protein
MSTKPVNVLFWMAGIALAIILSTLNGRRTAAIVS